MCDYEWPHSQACVWKKKVVTIYWESYRFWFALFPLPPHKSLGMRLWVLFHTFSAICYFYYRQSMDCPHTQTIKFTFKNETVNKTWSHSFLTCVACRLLWLEHCFTQAKHSGRFRMQPRGTKLPPHLICSLFVFTVAPPPKQLKFAQR